MKELEERILKDGELVSEDILKVGSFYNQQIDSVLIHNMAVEWKKLLWNYLYCGSHHSTRRMCHPLQSVIWNLHDK